MTPKVIDPNVETAWKEMLHQGHTRAGIARQYGVSRQRVAQVVGAGKPPGAEPKREERTVYLLPGTWDAVTSIAARFNLRLIAGGNAGKGSIAQLLDGIASGDLEVRKRGS